MCSREDTMKKIRMLAIIGITLYFAQPVFCLQFMGAVNHVDFYRLDAIRDIKEFQGLQEQVEHYIQKEEKSLQQYYNSFKKSEATLIVGLNQELKLMACCFTSNDKIMQDPVINVLPRAKNSIDAACLKYDLLNNRHMS